VSIIRTNRQHRRTINGQVCPACNVRMHHADIVALRTDDQLIYLHGQCALAIAEQADAEATQDLTSNHDANGDGQY
jgi:hypothetical protein